MPRTRFPAERTDPKNLDYAGVRQAPYPEEDLVGVPPLEEEPFPSDILPDQIQRQGKQSEDDEDEREITARPREEYHPIPPNELPEG
jgi:hypothetical protein